MTTGHEKLHRLNEVVDRFEEAVRALAKKGLTQSEVPLKQDVDRAREALVKTVVDMVTEAKMEGAAG